jgi:hypothetical protein
MVFSPILANIPITVEIYCEMWIIDKTTDRSDVLIQACIAERESRLVGVSLILRCQALAQRGVVTVISSFPELEL